MFREREHRLECLLATAVGILHTRAVCTRGELTPHEQRWLEEARALSPGIRRASDLIVEVQREMP